MRSVAQAKAAYNDLTTKEVAAMLRVTPEHVRDLIAAGKFPSAINISPHRQRREWRIPASDVERFRKENSAGELLKRSRVEMEKAAGEETP